MSKKHIEVWYDDASGVEPKWCVSLCEPDGSEDRCLSTHDEESDAVAAGEAEAEERGLKCVCRS